MVDVNRMTAKVQEALQQAGGIAARRNHQGIDVEHLLLAFLAQENGVAPTLLEAAGLAPRAVQEAVERGRAR
jgi:ATP-dependent Clp protease ATP-binding subunit ClpB